MLMMSANSNESCYWAAHTSTQTLERRLSQSSQCTSIIVTSSRKKIMGGIFIMKSLYVMEDGSIDVVWRASCWNVSLWRIAKRSAKLLLPAKLRPSCALTYSRPSEPEYEIMVDHHNRILLSTNLICVFRLVFVDWLVHDFRIGDDPVLHCS